MAVSLITLGEILVNINELRLLHHRELIKQKLNDSLKWQCIFDTNPSPIVIQYHIMLPICMTRSYAKLQSRKCCRLSKIIN